MRLRAVLLAGAAALLASCSAPVQHASLAQPNPEALDNPPKAERVDLGVCSIDSVVLKRTVERADEKSAETVRNNAPEVARVVHGEITIGLTNDREPATRSEVVQDQHGQRVEKRSAYVIVQDGLRIPAGHGPATVVRDGESRVVPDRTDRRFITAQAWVADARTGEMLRGWSCATRVEKADGRVIETRGADPDKTTRVEK